MPPTLANGKICYVMIPSVDPERSAKFYEAVFGWEVRRRDDGRITLNDGAGEVSGAWVTGRPPSLPGLLLYIMVDDIAAASRAVVSHGGEIVEPAPADPGEMTATFRDPGGNVIGLYQEH